MTWATGDLALCIAPYWERLAPSDRDPRRGGLYTVQAVARRGERVGLVFAGYRYVYRASGFRRIAPLTEVERREALADFFNFHRTGG